jgi:hypothetical protein
MGCCVRRRAAPPLRMTAWLEGAHERVERRRAARDERLQRGDDVAGGNDGVGGKVRHGGVAPAATYAHTPRPGPRHDGPSTRRELPSGKRRPDVQAEHCCHGAALTSIEDPCGHA